MMPGAGRGPALQRWFGVGRQVGPGAALVGEVQPGPKVERFFQKPERSRDVNSTSVSRSVALLTQRVKLGPDDAGRYRLENGVAKQVVERRPEGARELEI